MRNGCKNVVFIAANYAPGQDTFDAFKYGVESRGSGGKIVDRIPVPRQMTSSRSSAAIEPNYPTILNASASETD